MSGVDKRRGLEASTPFRPPATSGAASEDAPDGLLDISLHSRFTRFGLFGVLACQGLMAFIEVLGKAAGVVYDLSSALFLLTAIGTMVAWGMWTYRMAKNLNNVEFPTISFTPGWVVGWWFVPFANLFKPYLVTKELFEGSTPDAELPRAPRYLPFWCALWIASVVMARVANRASDPEVGPMLDLVASSLGIATTAVMLKLVTDLTARHTRWLDERRSEGG